MDEAEARRILERLAGTGPPTAQVASIKVLREMDKAAKAEAEAERQAHAVPPGFEGLYDDEFSQRQAAKAKPRAQTARTGGRNE